LAFIQAEFSRGEAGGATSITRIAFAGITGCFDLILLNGLIQPFQQPERVVGFFNSYRELYPVRRQVLRGIAENCQSTFQLHAE
jgi:hypothetical protein